jgi:hypothetical protein
MPRAVERRCWRLIAGAVLVATSGCYSFSSYQSPRLLKPGEFAVTPSVSRYQFTDDGAEWEHGDWTVEVQASAGVAERAEVGVKLARISLDNGYQFIGVEPRFALVTDHVALGVLLGTFYGEDIDSDLQLHPSLVFGSQFDPNRAELVAGLKALFVFADPETETLAALNLGLRLSSDLTRWAVHPELGLLLDSGEDPLDPIVQFGLGVWVKP